MQSAAKRLQVRAERSKKRANRCRTHSVPLASVTPGPAGAPGCAAGGRCIGNRETDFFPGMTIAVCRACCLRSEPRSACFSSQFAWGRQGTRALLQVQWAAAVWGHVAASSTPTPVPARTRWTAWGVPADRRGGSPAALITVGGTPPPPAPRGRPADHLHATEDPSDDGREPADHLR